MEQEQFPLNYLLEGKSLSRKNAELTLARIIEGPVTPEQVGAFLIALRVKQEAVDDPLQLLKLKFA